MQSLVPVTENERQTLPAVRARWIAHIAGLLGLFVGTAILFGERAVFGRLDPIVVGWDLPLPIALVLLVISAAAPWAATSPLLFRVGLGWGTVLLICIVQPAAPFVGWTVGFRLARIPYRDWRPSARQRPYARPIPGTDYHVLEGDLEAARTHPR